MIYPNLFDATIELSRKLYEFDGHHIDPTHTSYCFDKMARAMDYIKREPAAKSVDFNASIYINGSAVPVIVTMEGTGIHQPIDVSIQMA